MRDVLEIRISSNEQLVIATDNSGAIGMKEHDAVRVPYSVVGYFGFRVAVMECMAAGGEPAAVVLHNFCPEEAWEELEEGIAKGCRELGIPSLPVSGSTESNFSMLQSAVGMLVLGRKSADADSSSIQLRGLEWAVAGSPLVGEEVLRHSERLAPLPLFAWMLRHPGVKLVVPAGSKGVMHELRSFHPGFSRAEAKGISLEASAGPAACFLLAYEKGCKEILLEKAGPEMFHPLDIT